MVRSADYVIVAEECILYVNMYWLHIIMIGNEKSTHVIDWWVRLICSILMREIKVYNNDCWSGYILYDSLWYYMLHRHCALWNTDVSMCLSLCCEMIRYLIKCTGSRLFCSYFVKIYNYSRLDSREWCNRAPKW